MSDGEKLEECTFSVEDVLKILQELREELTPGTDGVHPKVLKECAD